MSKEERLYRALDDHGPLTGLLLVRDHDFDPAHVFVQLRRMEARGLVAKCEPPEDRHGQREGVAWYSLTLKGQQELANKFGR